MAQNISASPDCNKSSEGRLVEAIKTGTERGPTEVIIKACAVPLPGPGMTRGQEIVPRPWGGGGGVLWDKSGAGIWALEKI